MYNVGIDLGGTKIAAGLVDDDGKILFKRSIPTGRGLHYSQIVSDMAELALDVVRQGGASLDDIESIGVGSPGAADSKTGTVIYYSGLNFRDVPLAEELRKHVSLPVLLENDADCAALAESIAGAARGTESSLTVTFGTGVGCGIVIGGRLYGGFNHAAGEAGHMVICMGGERCSCGRNGCWEAYASGTALAAQARRAAEASPQSLMNCLAAGNPAAINGLTAFEAARKGDEAAVIVIDNYIRYVSEGLINLINLMMPEAVVIGGGVSQQGDFFLEPLKKLVCSGIYGGDILPRTRILAAELGNDAGIIGAAMLKRQMIR
jgi:glucokinase